MEIKQFELAEKPELLSFLQTFYAENPRMSDVRFWDWHFLQNPYVDTDNLPVWIAKNGDEIVGQLATTTVKLKVGELEKPAIWIIDLAIDRDFRRGGLMKKLVAAALEFCPLGLGMTTAEQHSISLLESIGWRTIGKIPRYNKLLLPGEALREISQNKLLRRFANALYAPLRPNVIQDFFSKNNVLRFVRNFDSSFDKLWQEASAQWTYAVVRDAAILKWQYFDQPDKKYDVLGFYENENLLGYVVLYFRKADSNGALSKAAITDFCYHPAKAIETVDALLRGALQLALERRAGALVTDVSDSLIEQRLKFFGFGRVKNPLQLLVKSADQQPLIYDQSKWFLTRGDSDTSVFEQANL